jgi:hypothetical protein
MLAAWSPARGPFRAPRPASGATDMAKGQQRGNREKKKPKQVKTAAAPVTSQYSLQPIKSAAQNIGLGKKR